MSEVPTVKIARADSASGFAIINESDFNPKKHQLFDAVDDEPNAKALEDMTRAQLDALAAERGVDIKDAKNKGDVIAALELAAEAAKAAKAAE